METVRVFGIHQTNEFEQYAQLALPLLKRGIIPRFYAWDHRTIREVRHHPSDIYAIDSLNAFSGYPDLVYASPGDPMRLKHDFRVVYLLGADAPSSLWLFPPDNVELTRSALIKSWAQIKFGEDDVSINNFTKAIEEATADYHPVAVSNCTDFLDKDVILELTRLMHPAVFSYREMDLRNSLVTLKARDAQRALDQTDGVPFCPAVILFGQAHEKGADLWDDPQAQKEIITAEIAGVLNNTELPDNSLSTKQRLIGELAAIFGGMRIWRVRRQAGVFRMTKMDEYLPIEKTLLSPTILEIIKGLVREF